jgi:hypothetical protein
MMLAFVEMASREVILAATNAIVEIFRSQTHGEHNKQKC